MMYFIFDTETTGLVKFDLPPDHPAQPHLVQLGCILADEAGKELASVDLMVQPEGFSIPAEATKAHGITTEVAMRWGLPLRLVVTAFTNVRSRADAVVAHNLPFDERVMMTAIHRTGRASTMAVPEGRFCTLEMAEPILKLPATAKMVAAGYGAKFKKPNLGECYRHFFGEELVDAHKAIVDARACARVFFHMRSQHG